MMTPLQYQDLDLRGMIAPWPYPSDREGWLYGQFLWRPYDKVMFPLYAQYFARHRLRWYGYLEYLRINLHDLKT